MKEYRPTYFLHIPVPLLLLHFPVWDTEVDHFCLYTLFLTALILAIFLVLCRKITGSTYLQLMYIWLERNASN